jgi:hypothetical protein
MNQMLNTHLQDLHAEGDLLFFNLHGRPCSLLVENHMRQHIVREAEYYGGFGCMSGAPDLVPEPYNYHPELKDMEAHEWHTLIALYKEDIVVSDE